MKDTTKARLTFDTTKEFLQEVKVFCAINNITLKDYVTGLIKSDMENKKDR